MAITLSNYYNQYIGPNPNILIDDFYFQPGGPTIPNPNNPNNNDYTSPGTTFGNNPTPFIVNPISSELVEASIAQPMTRDTLGGRAIAGGIDTDRINHFLATPEGNIFVTKQQGLQRMNSKIPFEGQENNTRIFDIDNLVEQVGLEAVGKHIERHGSPAAKLEYPDNQGVYSSIYGQNPLAPFGSLTSGFSSLTGNERSFDSSIINLYDKLSPVNIANDVLGIFGASGVINEVSNLFGSIGPTLGQFGLDVPGFQGGVGSEWFSYNGGPKSSFGDGKTEHRRWVVSNDDPTGTKGVAPNPLVTLVPSLNNLFPDLPVISSTAIKGLPGTLQGLNREGLSLDARAGIGDVGSRTAVAQGSLFGVSPLANRRDLTKSNPSSIDKINNLSLLKGPISTKAGINQELIDIIGNKVQPEDLHEDLIRFRFEAINNNKPTEEAIYTIFRAFLNNISDRFGANWTDNQYVGRGEKFFIYNGFTRDISFNFTIAPQTRDEVKPLIQKLNFLTSNIMPDYNSAGRMRGPFMKLTIGDYFVSLPGFISSLTYTIKDEAPWDIALYKSKEVTPQAAERALDNPGTNVRGLLNDLKGDQDFFGNERQLPHMIDVSVSYTPIHDFLPKKGTNDVFYILGKDDSWITELPPMEGWGNENLEKEKELSRKEQRKQKRESRRAERRINRNPENFRPIDGPSF